MSDSKYIPAIIQPDMARPPSLAPATIHLYVVTISDLLNDESRLAALINQEEAARANRFLNPQHGRHYRCMRGLLRELLSRYTDTAPQSIQFKYAEHGKPYLAGNSDLQFNMSHSRDMAAYALCMHHEIGVDIEYMREQKNLQGMIRHVASQQELDELSKLSATDAHAAFYRLWTRKEAFIKAVGRGLGMGLRSIHIGTQASDLPLTVKYKDEIMKEWLISDFKPPQDYKLAVCAHPLS